MRDNSLLTETITIIQGNLIIEATIVDRVDIPVEVIKIFVYDTEMECEVPSHGIDVNDIITEYEINRLTQTTLWEGNIYDDDYFVES